MTSAKAPAAVQPAEKAATATVPAVNGTETKEQEAAEKPKNSSGSKGVSFAKKVLAQQESATKMTSHNRPKVRLTCRMFCEQIVDLFPDFFATESRSYGLKSIAAAARRRIQ